jgi:hypothetical protein
MMISYPTVVYYVAQLGVELVSFRIRIMDSPEWSKRGFSPVPSAMRTLSSPKGHFF